MSEIPTDVMKAAISALFGNVPDDFMATVSTRDNVLIHRCARAILAERERCAAIADRRADVLAKISGYNSEVTELRVTAAAIRGTP